jgi:hypothetical protein
MMSAVLTPAPSPLAEAELPPDRSRFAEPATAAEPPSPVSPPSRPKIRETVVRSILFRRRLAEALLTLELQVLDALRQAGRPAYRVGNYIVRDTPTGLSITEAPPSDARQLELPFGQAPTQTLNQSPLISR